MMQIKSFLAGLIPALVAALFWFGHQESSRWMSLERLTGGPAVAVAALDQKLAVAGSSIDKLLLSPEVYLVPVGVIDVSGWLAGHEIAVYEEDLLSSFPNPALMVGSRVSVWRAQHLTINDAGHLSTVRTWQPTIGEALTAAGVELGEHDRITPALEAAALTPTRLQPVAVNITRVVETEVKVKESIPFKTVEKNDANLEKGLRRVTAKGRAGERVLTYFVRRENGEEVSRRLVDTTVTSQPENEQVTVGTKVVSYGSGVATWYTKSLHFVAAHNTLPRGTKVRVVNPANGQSVVVTVVGGGLYTDAVIDLSYDAFAVLASPSVGRLNVRLEKVYE